MAGTQPDALVCDAQLRNAVAGIRGLGRAGVGVAALASRRGAAGLWSRYTSARFRGPDALSDGRAFIARVRDIASRHGPVVVYPAREETIDALLAARGRLAPATLPYPNPDALGPIRDKRLLSDVAREAAVAAPATLAAASAGELRGASLPLPCVIKPALPGSALGSAHRVTTPEEADALLARVPDSEQVLVQERLTGPLCGVALVVDRGGRLAARFQQSAPRLWPIGAGMSRLAVSVAPEKSVVAAAQRVLAAVGYTGLAQLQFVRSPSGPVLVDVNPRFYGSLPLALATGVNLPAVWHGALAGDRLPGPCTYRVGVTYRWLEGDVLAAVRGSVRPLATRAPSPRVGAVWAPDDPLPSALLATDAVAFGVRGAARRLGS